MWLATLLLLHLPTALDVTVEPLSGLKQSGALVELDDQHVVIEVGGKKQAFDVRDLLTMTIRAREDVPAEKPAVWVELIDGSHIMGAQYSVQDRSAEILTDRRKITVETRNIRAVRFHPPSEALDGQWQEMLNQRSTGDIIVLRRSKTSLDQLEGVFHDITADTVEFEYDDQRIPVKLTKLEGMIYYHPVGRELPDSVCAVQEVNGTTWLVKTLELQDDRLQLVTAGGTRCELPWDTLARLDFSSGNVVFLSDLDFDLAECTPYIATRVSPKRIMQLYAPRRDASFEGSGLWLGAGNDLQQYDRGLAIHSRSQLIYRFTEPYRKLTAVAGIDSRLQGRGNLVLVIEGDGKELFRRDISGKDAPLPLDLNIEGVRRLKILVDFGETLDVADHLNLCNARILK